VLAAAVVAAAAGSGQTPGRAASDLDTLMSAVLDTRDENWRKLRQYAVVWNPMMSLASIEL